MMSMPESRSYRGERIHGTLDVGQQHRKQKRPDAKRGRCTVKPFDCAGTLPVNSNGLFR